jgi:hypothetical protein
MMKTCESTVILSSYYIRNEVQLNALIYRSEMSFPTVYQ